MEQREWWCVVYEVRGIRKDLHIPSLSKAVEYQGLMTPDYGMRPLYRLHIRLKATKDT